MSDQVEPGQVVLLWRAEGSSSFPLFFFVANDKNTCIFYFTLSLLIL